MLAIAAFITCTGTTVGSDAIVCELVGEVLSGGCGEGGSELSVEIVDGVFMSKLDLPNGCD